MNKTLLLVFLSATQAWAASLTWDGSTSGNWATGANWTGGAAPTGTTGSPDTLTFPTAGANKTMSNNLTAGLSFNRLSLTDGYTVSGNGLTLRFLTTNGNPQVNYTAASGEATVNVPLTLVNPATFLAAAGGRLNLGASSDPVLGANTLTLTASSNGRIEMDGSTSGTGNIVMNGAGLVVLDASQNSIGTYSLTAGSCTLLTSTIAGPITTSAGTQLSVINANASSSVTLAGNLDVGLSFDIAGNLTFNGSGSNDDLTMGIGGTLPGSSYDQISVEGNVTTGAHRLQLSAAGGYPLGTEFKLIANASPFGINSATKFLTPSGAAINESSEVNYGTLRLRFSYAGGDGNDFSATVVPAASSGSATWDGGTDAANELRTADNWSGDTVPLAGQVLVFSNAASEKTILNNGGGNYGGLQFTGTGGYLIQDDAPSNAGKLIMLSGGGISASHTALVCTLATPLSVVANQNWNVSSTGALTIDTAGSVLLEGFNLTLNPSSTGALNLNAPVSGTGSLNKDGSGLAVVGGAVANTFAGTTTVSRGELRLSKSGSAAALTGSVSVGGGANTATLSTTAAENIADTAVLTLSTNGTLQFGGTETLAGLVFNGGTVNNGANLLALNGSLTANENLTLSSPLQFNGANREITVASGKTLTLSGALSISPGVLGVTHFKKGTGTLIFSGTAPAVALSADAGVLQIDTVDAVNRPLVSLNGGTVRGNGLSRQVTSAAGGGTFSPGLGTGSSIWRNTGLAFNAATTVVLDLNGTTAGTQFDQLMVLESGTVSLGNAALQIRDTQIYPLGTTFRIIDNDGTDAVTGTFAGLPAGASIGGTFNRYTVSYAGGTGNDVVLTVAAVASGVTRTWTGDTLAIDGKWSNPLNWDGPVPRPGDTLVFPLTAMRTTAASVNDLPPGMIFNRIRFTGAVNDTGNFTISGNAIGLVAGIENMAEETGDPFSREIRIGLPITAHGSLVMMNNPLSNPRTLVFTQGLTTQGVSVLFVGRGGASPNGRFRFSGASAVVSGNSRLVLVDDAQVSLSGFGTDTWSGGTEIIHGSLSSIPHARLAEGFVLTAGANPVSASILAGTVTSGTAISVPENGSLTGGPLLCASLNVVGTATLGGGATVTGTVDVTGTLATPGATLSAATLNAFAGATISGGSLSATTLNNTNATLNFTGSAAIGGGVVVDGSDVFTCAALTTTDFLRDGGTFTATDMTLSGGFSLISVNQTIAGRLTFQPGAVRLLSVGSGAFFTAAALGGPIGTPVSIQKIAGGFVHITDSLSNIGGLTITDGYFLSDAPDGDSGVQIVSVEGGTLGGSGVFSDVVVATTTPARVSPGASPGILTADSLLTFGGGNIAGLTMEISGPSVPGTFHDQIRVMGDVDFTGSGQMQFDLSITGGYQPLTGTVYTFVEKVSPGPIGSVLNSGATILSEGQELEVDGITFRFSYLGGDGNDFTATVLNSPAGAYRIWDGGGADNNWTTGENWVGDSAPLPAESLRFPAGAARTSNNNNFDADTAFGEIKIESSYTLSGNRVRPTRGVDAAIPSGIATLALPLLFETGDTAEIELSDAGTLNVTGQISLGGVPVLTLRRTDPAFVFGGQTLDVASIRRIGVAANEVQIEGGGRVRFLTGTRDYTGTTFVRHGRLQLSGATAGIPGNLTLGGGTGAAQFENPGAAAAGIPNFATLRLEPNGEHLFIGNSSHIDTVGTLDFAGGITTGGLLPARFKRITRTPFNYSTTGTQMFETSVVAGTKSIEIETGATHTIPSGSAITTGDAQPLNLSKDGGGELLIGGVLSAATVQAAAGTLTVEASGRIDAPVTVAGGTLAGAGSINGDLLGNASGGTIAPGLPTGANPFGILTIHENDYLPAPQTTLSLQIGGLTPGTQHDQIRQTRLFQSPTLDLNESQLAISLANGFQPSPGQTFRIIDKQTPGAIVRNFAGKPEGHTFTAAGYEWTITYQGGDGNDALLTAGNSVTPPEMNVTAFTFAPPPGGAPGNQITATVTGPASTQIRLEASSDLTAWTILTTATSNAGGTATFNFTDSLAGPRRYYRFSIP